MRLFSCDNCGNTIHFDNGTCVACSRRLGYVPSRWRMTSLEPSGEGWNSLALGESFAFCTNAEIGACNWLLPIDQAGHLCPACRHNRTIPALTDDKTIDAFRRVLSAERHLFYSLLAWRLPVPNRVEDPEAGLAFDFLADEIGPDGGVTPVMTGHTDGVITLAIAEADDAAREERRVHLGEPYRTLLGHFRHEIGHYYWDRLVRDGGRLDAFRAVFGDERQDYAEALQRNYREGPPADWQNRFVSTYAACHPWEDFAETFAHYIHMVDALETAHALGLAISPRVAVPEQLDLEVDFAPYRQKDFGALANAWPPLTVAVNEINRSLGQRDFYPFVLSAEILSKLEFVHELIAQGRSSGT
nr:putative zinc-binding peptidase [Pleomorphomonas oryzae]